jgi:hypothetical protein
MNHIGIDYGMGTTNRDPANGIRYGVISQHDITQAWSDSSEAVYPEIEEPEDAEDGDFCADYAEPIGYTYSGDGYELQDCLDSDVVVLKSPFYTFARFCSPCVPGACSLNSPMDGGAQCYALGHDWFYDSEPAMAPYPVYSVMTDREVFPDSWYGQ